MREIKVWRLIWANLFLRALLLLWVLITARWVSGDTMAYLNKAAQVCREGLWGGELNRPPLPHWLLCLSSNKVSVNSTSSEMLPYLAIQTVLIWLTGVLLYEWLELKKRASWVALLWLYEPVLFIYGALVMTDGYFACFFTLFLIGIFEVFENDDLEIPKGMAVATGIAAALMALVRANGMIVFAVALAFYGVRALQFPKRGRKRQLLRVAVVFVAFALVVAPRVYWNSSRFDKFTIAAQGGGWLPTVAAVVEYRPEGLSDHDAEIRFNSTPGMSVARTLKEHPFRWAWLSAIGTTKNLFGHVNGDVGYILTGKTPIGPGWLVKENREGVPYSKWSLGPKILWLFGVFFFAATACVLYYFAFRLPKKLFSEPYRFWKILLVTLFGLQALMPLVHGGGRFRIGLLSAVIILAAFREKVQLRLASRFTKR